MSKAVQELQQIRSDLKTLGEVTKKLPSSRYMSLSITALEEATMFVGGTIKELNNGKSPYVNSENPFNETIDPYHKDENVRILQVPVEYSEWSTIQRIKWLRMMLELTVTKIRLIDKNVIEGWGVAVFVYAQLHVIKAKNWLGMELGSIRDQAIETESQKTIL
jgi:hypothetical protein